jgi:hypothetical protein
MHSELWLAPKLHTSRLRSLSPFRCPRKDQVTFEFGEPAEYRQHQPPMWRGGIAPRIAERLEARASLADCIESIQSIARRSC